jgi:homoserine O-acetyltransferase/O-succinyltransferase
VFMPALSDTLARQSIGRFTFESGITVDDAALTYALEQPANPIDGLVIVCPSLTGTPAIQQAWWHELGAPLAHQRYATLYPHGFSDDTLASSDRAHPPSIRDIARGIVALVQTLELPHATFVTGGSMGGMLALEVCIESGAPTYALVLAAPAVQTAWGAGWNLVQLQALQLGGAVQGLALARAVGMMSYRSELEFESRFGHDAARDGRTMAGYLEHHGQALIARFDAREYERRLRAMDTHDVGRDRGGWRDAIAPHAERITAVGIAGDALYSADAVAAWAQASGAEFVPVTSIHGHDAFILERDAMRAVIESAFAKAILVTSQR